MVPDNAVRYRESTLNSEARHGAFSSHTSTWSALPRSPAVASNAAAQTSSSSTSDGTAKTSACQMSSQAVSPAVATGPTSSNQTRSANSSVARGRRHHHWTSALPTCPRADQPGRARCRTVVVASRRRGLAAARVAGPRRSSVLVGRSGRQPDHPRLSSNPRSVPHPYR